MAVGEHVRTSVCVSAYADGVCGAMIHPSPSHALWSLVATEILRYPGLLPYIYPYIYSRVVSTLALQLAVDVRPLSRQLESSHENQEAVRNGKYTRAPRARYRISDERFRGRDCISPLSNQQGSPLQRNIW